MMGNFVHSYLDLPTCLMTAGRRPETLDITFHTYHLTLDYLLTVFWTRFWVKVLNGKPFFECFIT